MNQKYVIFILMFSSNLLFASRFPSNEINLESKREKEEKIDRVQKNSHPKIENFRELNEIVAITQKNGTDIDEVVITGNSVIASFYFRDIIKKYIEKKDSGNIINLLSEIENIYIEKGYVTTRAKLDIQNSDLSKGKIVIKIIEGRIEEFESDISDRQILFSFPTKSGDILNIGDLDQGIDNLNSIPSNNASFTLLPGKNLGESIVKIENKKDKKISGNINYNNLGQSSTGEKRVKLSLSFDDILGINDMFSGTYQRKLGSNSEKNNENFSFYYRIPYKYWEFEIGKEEFEYLTRIHGLNRKYKSDGVSKNTNYSIRRVIDRDLNNKIDVGVTLTKKETKNYIENIKLITSSRKLSVIKVDLRTQRRFLNGLLYGDIAYYKGIDRFGAESDDKKEGDVPKAQFSKYTLDLSWYKPFEIKKQKFSYRFNFSGQYSDDILYSSEKIAIGDDTSVRGFKENSIMGDKGFYLRNELGYRYKIFEPFIAYDVGRVKDVYKDRLYKRYGNEMSGVSVGLRAYYGGFSGSITYSKAIQAPDYVEKKSHEIYLSLSYSF